MQWGTQLFFLSKIKAWSSVLSGKNQIFTTFCGKLRIIHKCFCHRHRHVYQNAVFKRIWPHCAVLTLTSRLPGVMSITIVPSSSIMTSSMTCTTISVTSIMESEGAEVTGCRFLPIIPCGDSIFVDLTLAEFEKKLSKF